MARYGEPPLVCESVSGQVHDPVSVLELKPRVTVSLRGSRHDLIMMLVNSGTHSGFQREREREREREKERERAGGRQSKME